MEWNGHKLNLLDTPGYADFVGEVISAVHAVEGAVVVVDSVAGVEVGTEIAWQYLDELEPAAHRGDQQDEPRERQLDQGPGGARVDLPEQRFVPLQRAHWQRPEFKGVYRLIRASASLGPDGKGGAVPDDVLPKPTHGARPWSRRRPRPTTS